MVFLSRFKLPIILAIALLAPLFISDFFDYKTKSFLYAVSLTLKALLISALPFLIFSFVFHCLISQKQRVLFFVALLISMVFCSHLLAINLSYFIGAKFVPLLNSGINITSENSSKLLPLWQISVPHIINNEHGLLMGFLCGVFFSIRKSGRAERFAKQASLLANWVLKKLFIPTLPFFILGFSFKLEHEKMLASVTQNYANILCLVVLTQIAYMFFLYLVAARFSLRNCLIYIRNMFAAMITAFSTISSAATMPVTMICTEKNINNREMAETIIPATANIHTLGSAIGLTMLALNTLLSFGKPIPGFVEFFNFALIYALAKFAVAGVPGGVIIVVSPILESHLGFTPEMAGVITAIYMLFDPFGTTANVTGNGAFAIIFSKLLKKHS
jgi:Na+/H+-dicarboxylate symporter